MAGKGKRTSKSSAKSSTKAAPTKSVQSSSGSATNEGNRAATGVLVSHPQSHDIQIDSFSLSFHGVELVQSCRLELNYGRRYGLIGANGCGKTTLMNCLAQREVPIPDHMDIFHLDKEVEASDMTALQAVIEHVDAERDRLEIEAEEAMHEHGPEHPLVLQMYERLDELDPGVAQKRAAEILWGLGFTAAMQQKKTRDFSGGWRMRISLAKALFIRPMVLLLDEPTNHLDLEACVWLEDYLKNYNRVLLMVSHSQDFLNGVCTNIVTLRQKKLTYYTGNYDQYVKTREELETLQMKRYNWERDQIADMKEYIARFGHGSAKLARQAQSKEKVLAKMVASGLTEKVEQDRRLSFQFPACGKLPPPVLMFQDVSFAYGEGDKPLLQHLDFGVDCDSRIALVGPNGAGKSTLLKLMCGELTPTDGMIRSHMHLRIARYHQHLSDHLDVELPALEFMQKTFPEGTSIEQMRAALGKFGLSGQAQLAPIKNLSDGQKSRVVFAWLAQRNPNMLLLDEPTNHLDIETIDALADALNDWEGGMVLVSHDFRLINQVAKEIWVVENNGIHRWEGDIAAYKDHLREKMGKYEA